MCIIRTILLKMKKTCGQHAATTNDLVQLSLLIDRFRLLVRLRHGFNVKSVSPAYNAHFLAQDFSHILQQQQQQFYYYLYKKYTFAPQIGRKLVMAGQAGTRTTLTKTSYHVNL